MKSYNTQIGLSFWPSGAACAVASADLICAAIDNLVPLLHPVNGISI